MKDLLELCGIAIIVILGLVWLVRRVNKPRSGRDARGRFQSRDEDND